ncbi:MAG: diacylglycerol/polyprenol kinase family protein [Pseudomonadota bacterium]
MEEKEQVQTTAPESKNGEFSATRHDLQWGRRLFHASQGFILATAYWLLFSHNQIVSLMGFIACVLYLGEQIRIHYPEYAQRFTMLNRYLLRAEERIKESSAFPYAMAVLLTMITFPQTVAVASIYVLAIADPLAAIVGIRFGKHKIVGNKTWEGSLVFFAATFLCLLLVLLLKGVGSVEIAFGLSFVTALLVGIFEVIPLRLDDNFTIPLFTAITFWFLGVMVGIHF